MKSNLKIGSFVLAVLMCLTAVFAVGCTPTSLNKEWAYKTGDNELAIGVYIYSLNLAYSQAQSFASEQLDDYSKANSDWLDKEIEDDDGNKQVAKDWIKEQADIMCKNYMVVDEQLAKAGIELSTEDTAAAEEQAETYWNVGQYASYGYVMPMKDDLEPYGISLESFTYATTLYSAKYSKLFEATYGKGGTEEVSDSELTDFFTENYVDYSYFTVNLYESTTDESGTAKDAALSEDDAKKLTDEIDGYAEEINKGSSYSDVVAKYMENNNIEADPSTSNVENISTSSLGEEVLNALKELDSNKASTLKVGSGDSAVYYLIYKNDIKNDVDDYIKSDTNRPNVLSNMKNDDFKDYLDGLAENLECEVNTSVLDKYQADLFFKAVIETTQAATEGSDE
ncbi:MAG TPA: hypothetical protein DD413_00425 [Ruminococcus sp.]|nr:hypothetical protein [Ruminococcus sp.]